MSEWYDELTTEAKEIVLEKLSKIKNDEDLIEILEEYHPNGYLNTKPIQNPSNQILILMIIGLGIFLLNIMEVQLDYSIGPRMLLLHYLWL